MGKDHNVALRWRPFISWGFYSAAWSDLHEGSRSPEDFTLIFGKWILYGRRRSQIESWTCTSFILQSDEPMGFRLWCPLLIPHFSSSSGHFLASGDAFDSVDTSP